MKRDVLQDLPYVDGGCRSDQRIFIEIRLDFDAIRK